MKKLPETTMEYPIHFKIFIGCLIVVMFSTTILIIEDVPLVGINPSMECVSCEMNLTTRQNIFLGGIEFYDKYSCDKCRAVEYGGLEYYNKGMEKP